MALFIMHRFFFGIFGSLKSQGDNFLNFQLWQIWSTPLHIYIQIHHFKRVKIDICGFCGLIQPYRLYELWFSVSMHFVKRNAIDYCNKFSTAHLAQTVKKTFINYHKNHVNMKCLNVKIDVNFVFYRTKTLFFRIF